MKKTIQKAIVVATFFGASAAYGITFDLENGETLPRTFGVQGNNEGDVQWLVSGGQIGTMTVIDSSGVTLAESPMYVDGDQELGLPVDFFATAEYETNDTNGVVQFTNQAVTVDYVPQTVEFEVLFETEGVEVEPEFPTENPLGNIAESETNTELSLWQKFLGWITFWK